MALLVWCISDKEIQKQQWKRKKGDTAYEVTKWWRWSNNDRSGWTISPVDKKGKRKRVVMDREYSLKFNSLTRPVYVKIPRKYRTSLQRLVCRWEQHENPIFLDQGSTFEHRMLPCFIQPQTSRTSSHSLMPPIPPHDTRTKCAKSWPNREFNIRIRSFPWVESECDLEVETGAVRDIQAT